MYHHGLSHWADAEEGGRFYRHAVAARFLDYLRPHKWRMGLSILFMVGSSATGLAGPYLLKVAIDDGVTAKNFTVLNLMAIAYGTTAVASWLCSYGQVKIMSAVGQEILSHLRLQLFTHLQRLSIRYFDRREVGSIMSRLTSDVGVLNEMLTMGALTLASDIATLVIILFIMVSMNVTLTLLCFVVLPLMLVILVIFARRARKSYLLVRQKIAGVNASLQENITGVRVAQSFTREARNIGQFDETNRENLDANVQAAAVTAAFMPAVSIISAIATALVVVFGGYQVLSGAMSVGVLVAFFSYVTRFFEPIRDLSGWYATLQASMVAGERIFELLDTRPEVRDRPDAIELPPLQGHVRFHHVSFAYENEPVLRDIVLEIPAGQTFALVGATGAGKSSLVSLLMRFYDVDAGTITLDGHDLRDVTQQSLRRQMGMVLQDTFLFTGTVRDNIKYGRLEATGEEMVAAAQAVEAHHFIQALPNGYDTEVEERGIRLSVGQRQLIAFARALLADPRILILDEATSNVDAHTELLVQRALAKLLKGRTAIVIAHRLSTIKNADVVVVLEEGRIQETGTHQELLARRGAYYNLYTMQFRQQEPSAVVA